MPREHIEFDVILTYAPDTDDFSVMLIYNHPQAAEDLPQPVDEALKLNTARLADLKTDADYGGELARMLYGIGDIRVAFERALAAADELPVHLRLLIDATAPARYHAVRWEALPDPGGRFRLTTRDGIRFSRHFSGAQFRPVTPLARYGTLQALVAVASPVDLDDHSPMASPPLAAVDVPAEIERARRALGTAATVRTLPEEGAEHGVTLERIIEALRGRDGADPVNILYLVCHGLLEDDGTPVVLLENSRGKAQRVKARALAGKIADLSAPPTIAALCSCQSAGPGDEFLNSASGPLPLLAPSLAEAGVAVIIAMHGNVRIPTANDFLETFFKELNRDGLVDRAAAEARQRVSERPDWWMPVLFSRLRRGKPWYEPRFGPARARMFGDLRARIENGNCTPVLGSGIAGEGLLPERTELARTWVQRRQMPLLPESQHDLARVTQYLSVDSGDDMPLTELQGLLRAHLRVRFATELPELDWTHGDVQQLISKAGELHRKKLGDTDPYAILAAQRLPIFVTTSWTNLLEDALREADKEPISRFFDWWTDWTPNDAELPQPDWKRPLVYHLFGSLDRPSSIVLTEDDYFSWLNPWMRRTAADKTNSIPGPINDALNDRALLFLGYSLDDWEFRVVFKGIKAFQGGERRRKYRHVGVQVRPETSMIEPAAAQEYLERYLDLEHVDIYWGSCTEFLNDLRDAGT